MARTSNNVPVAEEQRGRTSRRGKYASPLRYQRGGGTARATVGGSVSSIAQLCHISHSTCNPSALVPVSRGDSRNSERSLARLGPRVFPAIVSSMTRGGLDHLRSTIETHVQREGLRPLSARTGIPVGQLRSLMDGRAALSTTIERASTALGLEFYVGPPHESDSAGPAGRAVGTPDSPGDREPSRSSEAPEAATPAWVVKLRHDLREDLATLLREFSGAEGRALLAIGSEARPPALSGAAPNADSIRVRVLDVTVGGGSGGATPLERAPVTGYQEFPRRWLESHEIDAGRCAIVGIRGDAMEPTLPDGCSILVDYTHRRPRVGGIFVVRFGTELMVRRALRDRAGRWRLAGDHNRRTPPIPWDRRGTDIVGEVRWMANTFAR